MKFILPLILLLGLISAAQARPAKFVKLLPFVQAAPDQGETNTCWFMASTGAMELLLNKKYDIRNPKPNGRFDLSESFTIHQEDYFNPENPPSHFIEEIVTRFNHGVAVQNKHWPYNAHYPDGSDNFEVWNKHENFDQLPRIKVPPVKTTLLFAKGKRWATEVLEEADLEAMKEALYKKRSPLIVNYNDDGFWHVILIVGYHDGIFGTCYELEKKECKKGAFFVRDSDGKRHEARAYNWFLKKGNAAAIIELK